MRFARHRRRPAIPAGGYFRRVDPVACIIAIENVQDPIGQIAQTTAVRNVVGRTVRAPGAPSNRRPRPRASSRMSLPSLRPPSRPPGASDGTADPRRPGEDHSHIQDVARHRAAWAIAVPLRRVRGRRGGRHGYHQHRARSVQHAAQPDRTQRRCGSPTAAVSHDEEVRVSRGIDEHLGGAAGRSPDLRLHPVVRLGGPHPVDVGGSRLSCSAWSSPLVAHRQAVVVRERHAPPLLASDREGRRGRPWGCRVRGAPGRSALPARRSRGRGPSASRRTRRPGQPAPVVHGDPEHVRVVPLRRHDVLELLHIRVEPVAVQPAGRVLGDLAGGPRGP